MRIILYRDDTGQGIQVSQLEGVDTMQIPHEDQGRLFLQFFSKAVLDRNLQDVPSASYQTDLRGIAKILDYGNKTGEKSVGDAQSAAYGLMAMVVGLSFFRDAGIQSPKDADNRYICEDYVKRLIEKK